MIDTLFSQQKQSIDYFFDSIDKKKVQIALDQILSCSGTLFFTGVGKSGFIAKKLAMTFVSTGTKAFFLSASEALHGDIGLVESNDLVIFLSKSGDTKELVDLIPFLRQRKAKILSIVSHQHSQLEKLSDQAILLPLQRELCPFNLAPTTSAALQLMFGDLLAVLVMQKKQITFDEYSHNHPSGNIGKKSFLKVKDLMLPYEGLPLCTEEQTVMDILPILSAKQCGSILVSDNNKQLLGIFTDGDLRRIIEKYQSKFLDKKMKDVMTSNFKFVSPNLLALEALNIMESNQKLVTVLPVLENQQLVGLIRMHDIVQSGIRGENE